MKITEKHYSKEFEVVIPRSAPKSGLEADTLDKLSQVVARRIERYSERWRSCLGYLASLECLEHEGLHPKTLLTTIHLGEPGAGTHGHFFLTETSR